MSSKNEYIYIYIYIYTYIYVYACIMFANTKESLLDQICMIDFYRELKVKTQKNVYILK